MLPFQKVIASEYNEYTDIILLLLLSIYNDHMAGATLGPVKIHYRAG